MCCNRMEGLDKFLLNCDMIRLIAVVCNCLSLLRNLSARNLFGAHYQRGYLRGFFNFLTVIVPHTKISTLFWWRGREGITLTQGGRVHEGATPSDKQTRILMMVVAESFNSGLINKAVARIKGRTPIRTVVGLLVWMLCSICTSSSIP